MTTTRLMINGQTLADVEVLKDPSLDPPSPVTAWAAIPGGLDIDVSTLLNGGIPMYNRTKLSLPCVLRSGETLHAARRRLSAQLSGQSVNVGFQEYPGWHVTGRAQVSGFSWPGKGPVVLFTLALEGDPYWWKDTLTAVAVQASTAGTAFSLPQTGYPVMPVATVKGGAVTLIQGTTQTGLPVGVTSWVDALLIRPQLPGEPPAPVTGKVVGAASTSTITFAWREGWPG